MSWVSVSVESAIREGCGFMETKANREEECVDCEKSAPSLRQDRPAGGGGATGHFVFEDMATDDFDALRETGIVHDQEYVKTSTQPFLGRKTSARFVEGVSVLVETMNSAMHHRFATPQGFVGLGVAVGAQGAVVNGVGVGRHDLVINRPGSEMELDASAQGMAMAALAIERTLLESLLGADAGSGFLGSERGGSAAVIRAPLASKTVEEGATTLVSACGGGAGRAPASGAATALVAGVIAALDFETRLGAVHERTVRKGSAATFAAARQALAAMDKFDSSALAAATGRGPRSIQQAFSQHAGTTPQRYFRALRMHRVRHALRAGPGDRPPQTIGDIAADHGFHDWSLFTRLYRMQFGELPSETRARGRNSRTKGASA